MKELLRLQKLLAKAEEALEQSTTRAQYSDARSLIDTLKDLIQYS